MEQVRKFNVLVGNARATSTIPVEVNVEDAVRALAMRMAEQTFKNETGSMVAVTVQIVEEIK